MPAIPTLNSEPPQWTAAAALKSLCSPETQGMQNVYHIFRARRKSRM